MKEIKIKVPNKESVKKVLKGLLVIIVGGFFLMAIGRPDTLLRILDKFSTNVVESKLDEANVEKKDVEQVIFMEDTVEYFVMYSDGTFDHTDMLEEVARLLTDKTGKAYAVDNGKLMAFDDGKLTRYEIHYGWKK